MENEFLSFQSINIKQFIDFALRLIFDFIIIYIVAWRYFKARQKRDILFALLLLNVVVFVVCYLLQSVQISIGFAFGIFAIFSILRYRTSTVPIKEMTYIFISISIAIINALTNINTGYGIMIFSNVMILFVIFIFENRFTQIDQSKTIIYDELSLIKPEKKAELHSDLEGRTGLEIHKVEVGRINFKSGRATIKIYY